MVRRLAAAFLLASLVLGCAPKVSDIPRFKEAAKHGDRGAMKSLVQFFSFNDDEARIAAYEGLLAVPDGDRDYVADLLIAIVNGHGGTPGREAAAALLGKYKAAKAVPALTALAGDATFTRRYVIYLALGEIQDAGTVGTLLAGLASASDDDRKFASKALIKLGKKAIPAMMERFPKASVQEQAYLIRIFGELRSGETEPLLTAELKGANRLDAIWAIGKSGTARSYPALVALLGDGDYLARVKACQALGDLNDPRAIPVLRKTLVSDEEARVREWAARAIEVLTGERTTYRDDQGRHVLPYNVYH